MTPLGNFDAKLAFLNEEIKKFELFATDPERSQLIDVKGAWNRFRKELNSLNSDFRANSPATEELGDLSQVYSLELLNSRVSSIASRVDMLFIQKSLSIKKLESLSKELDDLIQRLAPVEDKVNGVLLIKEKVCSLLREVEHSSPEFEGEIKKQFLESYRAILTKVETTILSSVRQYFNTLIFWSKNLDRVSSRAELSMILDSAKVFDTLFSQIPPQGGKIEDIRQEFNQLYKRFVDPSEFLEILTTLSRDIPRTDSLEIIESIKSTAEGVYTEFQKHPASKIKEFNSYFLQQYTNFLKLANIATQRAEKERTTDCVKDLNTLFEQLESSDSISEINDLKLKAETLWAKFQEIPTTALGDLGSRFLDGYTRFLKEIQNKEQITVHILMESVGILISDLDNPLFSILELKKRAEQVLNDFKPFMERSDLSDSDMEKIAVFNHNYYEVFLEKLENVHKLLEDRAPIEISNSYNLLKSVEDDCDRATAKRDFLMLFERLNTIDADLQQNFRVLEIVDDGAELDNLLDYAAAVREKCELKLNAEDTKGGPQEILEAFQETIQTYEILAIFSNSPEERRSIIESASSYHKKQIHTLSSLDSKYRQASNKEWLQFVVYTQKGIELPPISDAPSEQLNQKIQEFVNRRNEIFKQFFLPDADRKLLVAQMQTHMSYFEKLQDSRYEKVQNHLQRENQVILNAMMR